MTTVKENALSRVVYFNLILLFLSGCIRQSDKNMESDEVRDLNVKLSLSTPSYKDIFSKCDIIKLESSVQSMVSRIDKANCVNDSILLLDTPRSNVLLFSPEGLFLNQIGVKGDGPEDYYLCYDFAVQPSSGIISLLNPMGEIIDYTIKGRYIGRRKLSGKPNYYALEYKDSHKVAIWSCVEDDEAGLSLFDLDNDSIIYEDWFNDRKIDFRRMYPLFNANNRVYFAPPLTNDVYLVGDTSMTLKYSWKFSPQNITKGYLDEIRLIENSHEKNIRLINDIRSGTLKDRPVFNGETDNYYYIALETGVGEDSTVKSVFYNKEDGDYVVFTKFKEELSFRPVYMNEEFVLCQVPYDEVDTYNQLLGLNIKCSEDENPVLAKFYFKE